MKQNTTYPATGSCTCKKIQYRIEKCPLIVHCCHCTWCQRETGTAFALNAVIESANLTLLSPPPEIIKTPSNSGRGQFISRCPDCKVAVWSTYSGSGPLLIFVRVGTLDNPSICPPDIHIFTKSKSEWFSLDGSAKVVDEYYSREEVWREESLRRWKVLLPEVEKYRAGLAKDGSESK